MDNQHWALADFALNNKVQRVLLYGLPGTGKTYYAMNYNLNNKPAYRLVCTEEMTDGDLLGRWVPAMENGNRTLVFQEGVAIKAWRTGGRLVVDEINKVNSDIESRLMSLIDTYESSSWEHPVTGEIVTPDPDFSVVATMNGEPDDLGAAINDRLVVQLEVNTPHPDAIQSLPEYIRPFAETICSERDLSLRYSLRNFVEFVRAYDNSNDLETSARVCLPRIADQLVDVVAFQRRENGS